MQGIDVTVNKIGARADIALVKIKGYIDTTTSSDLFAELSGLMNNSTSQFIIDMGGVNYISSAGWGVFIGEIRNIRERGGDLKIVQMTPDVYEVFAMLEFNKILDSYEAIEEAINDFDISMGLDITKSVSRKPVPIEKDEVTISSPSQKTKERATERKTDVKLKKRWTTTVKPRANEAQLPLAEKIKSIIIDNPSLGLLDIKKELNTQRFGYHRVNIFKLRSILKKYNLETKEKRYRFYRSR